MNLSYVFIMVFNVYCLGVNPDSELLKSVLRNLKEKSILCSIFDGLSSAGRQNYSLHDFYLILISRRDQGF